MKIVISDKISEDGIELLQKEGFEVDYCPGLSPDELKPHLKNAEGLVVRSATKVTADILEAADTLKVIGRAGVGVDNVDVEAATRRGVIVMNTPGGNTNATAELTMAMMMALVRELPQAHVTMKERKWEKKKFIGRELLNKVLGIVGLGRIGKEVASRCRVFGMHILTYDPYVAPEILERMGADAAELQDIFRRADIITVHTPLNEETRGIIGKKEFEMMKDGVLIVNCARGGIIDENALVEALKSGKVAGAALDVFENEPLPPDHPFRELDRVILTPHIGAATREAQQNVAVQVCEQFVDFFKNRLIRNAVNAPSIEPEILENMRPYLQLAECLGKFQSQLAERRAVRLTAKYSGAVLDYPVSHLTTAVVKAFIDPKTDEAVNYVNALTIAKDMGKKIEETKIQELFQYTNLITVDVEQEDGTVNSVSGTLFTPSAPRIVIVNDKHFDAYPYGNMIVIENLDVPGIIGGVGTLLGKHKINIAQLTWGRRERDQEAMTIINVDQEVSPEALEELRQLPNILSVRLIKI